MMKPMHLLPPAAALVATGIWLGLQQRSISSLESQSVLLRQHIDAARAPAPAGGGSLAAARAKQAAEKNLETIDWKELAEAMAKAEGGIPDMRAMMKMQTKLMALEGAELIAALDEIAALDLGKQARQSLEGMLIGLLAQKDPKLVLERFLNHLNQPNGMMNWQLGHAFQQWAGKDGAAAVAWLDAQIAAGKFESKSLDGKSQARLQFEAAAVMALMANDPDAAGRRIAALPEDQRRELFQQGMMLNLKPGSEKAVAAMVRQHVPETERGHAFSSITTMMVHQGGLEKVGGFLDEIDATPAERKQVAQHAAIQKLQQLTQQGKLDRAALDEMRQWVGGQSPDEVDRITGEALANLWGSKNPWEDSAGLVEQLHAENPSDDLLVSFLEGHQAMQSPEAAIELAGKISDESKRAQLIQRFRNVRRAD
jgi:hypothetical protein